MDVSGNLRAGNRMPNLHTFLVCVICFVFHCLQSSIFTISLTCLSSRAHQQLQLSQQLSQQTPLLMANGGSNNTTALPQQDHVAETEMKIRKLEQELRARDEVIRELELRLAEEELPAPIEIIPSSSSEMDNNVEVENLLKQLEALR